jgi:hypothetical protein
MRQVLEQKQRMHEDIPLGMKLRRLCHSFHGFDFRQEFMQQSSLIEQQES